MLGDFGPGQMPPQGARALIRQLFRASRGGPNVSAVLAEPSPGDEQLEFTNVGGETAIGLRLVVEDANGSLAARSLGQLAPSAATSAPVSGEIGEPFRCVWTCDDQRSRLHIWSYDGRRKLLRRHKTTTDEACFRFMYG
ncbi:MAG: hypothetical protein QOF43_1955 [Gaiellaceae bacterium]|nr:hypothetical protein [Gaiellaceae bacterium]